MKDIFTLITGIITILSFIPIAWASIKWLRGNTYKQVYLKCGSFRIKHRYFNSVVLTPIVGYLFFKGGQVPNDIRQEILEVTGAVNRYGGDMDVKRSADYDFNSLEKNTSINGGSN